MKIAQSTKHWNILLPHISRIFSAKTFPLAKKAILFVFGIGFFAVNMLYFLYLPQPFVSYRQDILTHPFSIHPYVQFGQALFQHGNISGANAQMMLASNNQGARVLGAQTELHIVSTQWEHELSKQERTYNFWKHEVEVNPEYRDGYVQLALISYEMKRIDEARLFALRAQDLDPNNQSINELLKQMQ